MQPGDWATVRRLALCGSYSPSASLRSVVQQIQASQPQMELDVWVTAPVPPPNLLGHERVVFVPTWLDLSVVEQLQHAELDAAIILTVPHQSPYGIAYACYLAGIPIRVGQTAEFGGGVLSFSVSPPSGPLDEEGYYRHLLQTCGVIPTGDRPSSPSLRRVP